MPSTLRFLKQYLRPAAGATVESETTYQREGQELPATVYRPAGHSGALPGWVVLHGLTRPGRRHRSLIRFARAVASAGNLVYVPEIPEWRDLRVAPAPAMATIRSAVLALQSRDDVRHDRVGLFGFSFGATQALVAATDAEVASQLAGIAAWGGYSDLRRVFRFGLTGRHELDGTTWEMRPDPYGVWIMAGNYLPLVPGFEDSTPVAAALHSLAIESGEHGAYAWDPVYDPSKIRLRAGLHPHHRALFDMLAPLTTAPPPDPEQALEMAERLAVSAIAREPLLDPTPFVGHVRVPVVVAHGRDDRLIPFTESLRLARQLPASAIRSVNVTALFQHSGGTQAGLGPMGTVREGARFVLLLRRVLGIV
jgi:pimeloyl-ACP methyl ester carboxylesterase